MSRFPWTLAKWDGHGDDYNMQAEETEIDMVVSAWTKCHRCEGYGHLSRDCGTPAKGKGKDGKGGQKGNGKGGHQYQQQQYQHHHKGEGKGGTKGGKGSKGGGKGYQGTCWRCGQVGHKAAECTKHVHFVEEASPREVEEVEVGGVWMVGCVDGDWKTPKKPTMKMSEAPAKGAAISTRTASGCATTGTTTTTTARKMCSLASWRTRRGKNAGDQLVEDEGQCDEVPRCEGAEATCVGSEDRKGGEPYQHGARRSGQLYRERPHWRTDANTR